MKNKYVKKNYLTSSYYDYRNYFNNELDPMLSENNVIDYMNTIVNGVITKNAFVKFPTMAYMIPRFYQIMDVTRRTGFAPSEISGNKLVNSYGRNVAARNRDYVNDRFGGGTSSGPRIKYLNKMAAMAVGARAMNNMIESDAFRDLLYRDKSNTEIIADSLKLAGGLTATTLAVRAINNIEPILGGLYNGFLQSVSKTPGEQSLEGAIESGLKGIRSIPNKVTNAMNTIAKKNLTIDNEIVKGYRSAVLMKEIPENARILRTNQYELRTLADKTIETRYGANPFKKGKYNRNLLNEMTDDIFERIRKASIGNTAEAASEKVVTKLWTRIKNTISDIAGFNIEKTPLESGNIARKSDVKKIVKSVLESSNEKTVSEYAEPLRKNIAGNFEVIMDYERSILTKQRNAKLLTYGKNLYLGGVVASSFSNYISDTRKANNFVNGILSEMTMGFRNGNTFGSNNPSFSMSSEAAMSERQRAITAIQNSHLNARVYIGQEAKLRFQSEGF